MLKLLVVVLLLALLVYGLVRVLLRRGLAPARPVSPDDDEDFLRDLDRRRWEQRRHQPPPQDPDQAPDEG